MLNKGVAAWRGHLLTMIGPSHVYRGFVGSAAWRAILPGPAGFAAKRNRLILIGHDPLRAKSSTQLGHFSLELLQGTNSGKYGMGDYHNRQAQSRFSQVTALLITIEDCLFIQRESSCAGTNERRYFLELVRLAYSTRIAPEG